MVHSPPAPMLCVCLLVLDISKMKLTFSLLHLHLHLLLCAFLLFSHNPCFGKCIEEERLALLDLKQGLNDYYNLLSSWKIDDQDCCRWRGVVCHNRTGHVIRLQLSPIGDQEISYIGGDFPWFSFVGELRPSLLKLPFLYHLDLSMAHHLSEMPGFLGSLSRLSYLNFSRNMIGGHIPSQLGNLSRLRSLDLSFNNFTGDIPYQLGNLYNLQYLDLGGDYGTLNVDSLDWLSHLSSLRELKVSQTDFTGATDWLHSIKSSPSLSTIYMTYSRFCEVDPLSVSIANSSSSLKVISFTDCSIPSSTLPLLTSISSAVVDLTLAWNNLSGPILDSFANIDSLQHLDLSHNELERPIPKSLGNLCNLQTLDISWNQVTEPLQSALESLAGCAMTSLQIINLSTNRLEGTIPKLLGSLCNLQTLDVSYNNIREPIHDALDSLAGCAGTSLQIINLSGNMLTGALPNMTAFISLRELYLQSLQLKGPIPDSFANMGSLQLLSFASNDLEGPFSKSLGSLCNLQTLDVSDNNISELIHGALDSLAGCARTSLQKIDLSFNKLKGPLPNITGFKALRELYLNENLLEGFSSDCTFAPTSQIVTLDLTRNNLRGTVPVSIGELANLRILRLQSNHLVGVITELHFHNMFNLLELDLSFNSLALNFSPYSAPPFQSISLNLRSCKLGPRFPSWLRSQTNFSMLDISDSDILDVVPSWFWDNLSGKLIYLNMSHNSLSGEVPNLRNIFAYKPAFDLSSNLFYGSIPQFLSSTKILNLSNNTFHGNLSFLCTTANDNTFLEFLDLSNNLLLGRLPECLMNMRNLAFVNLGSNNFYGTIPDSIGWLDQLESLTLRNNSFSGGLPLSLKNCCRLRLLDVEENKLKGPIPAWLGQSLTSLVVLSLRDNRFDGQVPKTLCYLKSLQLLDLSSNNISGTIPLCVNNLTGLTESGGDILWELWYLYPDFSDGNYTLDLAFFEYSSQVIWKGGKQEYKQNLRLLKMIDLSRNALSGSIPGEMMSLVGLRALNLSGNMLTGRIPRDIGQLELVESLDLSANRLGGEIPYSLANLSYLSVLNLSNNNLSGDIPTSTQLQSFDATSYAGNPKLCGPPLPNKCPGSSSNSPSERAKHGSSKDEWFETIWFYSGAATGFVVSFWAIFGALALNTSTRVGFFRFMENISDWLYLAMALK